MSIKYRIYCITEENWKSNYSDTPLTVCPTNNEHTINPDSVQELDISLMIIRHIPTIKNVNSSNYIRIGRFEFDPNSHPIRMARSMCYISGGLTSMDIELNNTTDNVELLNTNVTNTDEEISVDLGTLSNIPTSKCIIEVNVKCNGVTANTSASIFEVLIYS